MSAISSFLSEFMRQKNLTLSDDTWSKLDSAVVLTDGKNLKLLGNNQDKKDKELHDKINKISDQIEGLEEYKEDKRKEYSQEKTLMNVLAGDVSKTSYVLSKMKLDKVGGKFSQKFQSFKDKTGLQKTMDNYRDFKEKGLFKYIRDKQIEKRLASTTQEEVIEHQKKNGTFKEEGKDKTVTPASMANVVTTLGQTLTPDAQNAMRDVKLLDDDGKPVEINDNSIKALIKASNSSAESLESIKKTLKKIQEAMIDRQDTSIQFGKKNLIEGSKDKKEQSKVKFKKTEDGFGLLDMLLGGAAAGALCKKFPKVCRMLTGGISDRVLGSGNNNNRNNRNNRNGGTFRNRFGGGCCCDMPGGLGGDFDRDRNRKKKGGIRAKSRFRKFKMDLNNKTEKIKISAKEKFNSTKEKITTNTKEKFNTVKEKITGVKPQNTKIETKPTASNDSFKDKFKKYETDKGINTQPKSVNNTNYTESEVKQKTSNIKPPSGSTVPTTSKSNMFGSTMKKGGKFALLAAGGYALYDGAKSFFENHKTVTTKDTSNGAGLTDEQKVEEKKVNLGNIYETAIIGKNVNMRGVDDDVMHNFVGLAAEYHALTGDKLKVTSGYRDIGHQETLFKNKYNEIKKQNPTLSHDEIYSMTRRWVAPPGNSMHNWGLALDVDYKAGKQMNKANSLGLLKKWNFHRPMSHEPWHIQGVPKSAQAGIIKEGKETLSEGETYNPVVARTEIVENEGVSATEMVTTTAAAGALALGSTKLVKGAEQSMSKPVKTSDMKNAVNDVNTDLKPTPVKTSSAAMEVIKNDPVNDIKSSTKPDIKQPDIDVKKPGIMDKFKGAKLGLVSTAIDGYMTYEEFQAAESNKERKDTLSSFAGASGGAMAGGALGATLGSIFPVFGTIIGGIGGSILGAIAGEAAVQKLVNKFFTSGEDFVHDDLKNSTPEEKKDFLVKTILPVLGQNGDKESYDKVVKYIKEDLEPKIKKKEINEQQNQIKGTGDSNTPLDKAGYQYTDYNEFKQDFSNLSKSAQDNEYIKAKYTNDVSKTDYIKQYRKEVEQNQANIVGQEKIVAAHKNSLNSTAISTNMVIEKNGSTNSNIQINNTTKTLTEKTSKAERDNKPVVNNVINQPSGKQNKTEEFMRLGDYSSSDSIEPLLGYAMSSR